MKLETNNPNDLDFSITWDAIENNYDDAINDLIQQYYHEAQKGGKSVVKRLQRIIKKYPFVKEFKNYLSLAYNESGYPDAAKDLNKKIVVEHPNYLFGKINLCHEYIQNGNPEKAIELLGNKFNLKELYPDRNVFHFTEVLNIHEVAVAYYCEIGDLKKATEEFELMNEIDAEHYTTDRAMNRIRFANMQKVDENIRLNDLNAIHVNVVSSIEEISQTDLTPKFENPEIEWLYTHDFRIPIDLLKQVLALPKESLIRDLQKVLMDSMHRYKYFSDKYDSGLVHSKQTYFPMHAMYLLGELKSNESLDLIFQTFRQGEDFLEFWFNYLMTECFAEPLLNLAEENIEKYEAFLLEPGIYTYVKSELSTALAQLALHKPDLRKKVISIYNRVLTFYSNASIDDNVIDSALIGLIIADLINVRAIELTDKIQELFDKKYVDEMVCGDFIEVQASLIEDNQTSDPKDEWTTLTDNYSKKAGFWYNDEEPEDHLIEDAVEYINPSELSKPKIGRNEPCLCGSGKKYKKCCL